jgi:steroid 5-alpha reductase family enzyme
VIATTIPLAFKLAYTAFVLYVVAVWWKHYGWKNFLWFSDIAFIGAVPALWLEDSALASILTVAVLVPELLWNVDFAGRLLLRRRVTGLTDYMFERDRPRILRALSLFHVPLPLVLLWMVAAYGYVARIALPGAIALAVIVLPLSRLVSDPEKNINWTYGLGARRSTLPAALYVGLLLLVFVVLVFIPTDLALRWFGFG